MKHPILMSSRDFNQNIHQHFTWMRQEAPVYQARFTRWQKSYLISRYHDVEALLKDPRLVKDANNAKTGKRSNNGFWMPKNFQPLLHNMLNTDEPDHRRLRMLVHKAFSPRRIMALAPRIEAIAHRLLDEAEKQGSFDLIEQFALPLPVTVIAEMMGIPEEDRPRFLAWTARIVQNPTPVNLLKAIPAVSAYLKYIRQLTEERRQNPQDDLLTALALAEEEGDKLTEDELLGTTFLLLVAGHETTVSLIANGTLSLLSHPDQHALLRQEPTLIESAIEEFLRYDGPLQTTEMSFAREPIILHGVTIPKGSLVLPALLSANRDETVFEEPAQLDITRTPNKHLAFGKGIHYCLGAPLARLEGKIAFCTLLERFPNLRLAQSPDDIHFRSTMLIHRLEALPVAV